MSFKSFTKCNYFAIILNYWKKYNLSRLFCKLILKLDIEYQIKGIYLVVS